MQYYKKEFNTMQPPDKETFETSLIELLRALKDYGNSPN